MAFYDLPGHVTTAMLPQGRVDKGHDTARKIGVNTHTTPVYSILQIVLSNTYPQRLLPFVYP